MLFFRLAYRQYYLLNNLHILIKQLLNRQYQFICNYLGYVSKRYFYEAIIIVSYFDDPQEYNKKILNNESESLRGPF